MEVPPKLIIIGAIGCLIVGAEVDHRFNAREVIKTVSVDHDVIQYKIVTVTHTVTAPDGTKTTDTTVTDNTEEQKKIINTIIDTKAPQESQWMVAAGTGLNSDLVKVYSLSIDRKILGPVSVGLMGSSSNEYSVRLGIAF